jgi:hypothetical protein
VVPTAVDEGFIFTLKRTFEESILGEIGNVIADVQQRHPGVIIPDELSHASNLRVPLPSLDDEIRKHGYQKG